MLRSFACFIIVSLAANYADAEYYTLRVLSRSGSAYAANVLKFTPDSKQILFSSGKGVMVVAVDGFRVQHEQPINPFTIAITPDSKQALMASSRATQAMNLATGQVANIRWQLPPGIVGLRYEEQGGKLLVTNVTAGGPAEEAKIKVGDEIVATHEFGERRNLLGRGEKAVTEALQGPAGTNLGISIIPRGQRGEKRIDLVRRRGEVVGDTVRLLPPPPRRNGVPVTAFSKDEYHVFLDAASGEVNSILATEEVEQAGLGAVSPDGKRFAIVADRRQQGDTEYMVEVFDLATRQRVFSIPYDDSYYEVQFSADSQQFLIGSHDSVYVLDLDEREFTKQINLGWKPTLRIDTEDIEGDSPKGPTGWWFKESSGRSPDRLLTTFDMTADGTLAVGAPNGEVTLWSATDGTKIRQVEPPSGRKVEKVRISPDSQWITYYISGTLTLDSVAVDSEGTPGEEPDSAAALE
ncbi:PD40 domain-containing protein [Botrimarina mediterranea]|uniref:PD40 domain-containing protein n=1 Tax=Botrimarina mediterranea TaxID=2528022 RepID=UPI00118A2F1A|nr:hypothetical protein K2D_19170 [Planctomycetes bacterium K2D]